MHALLNLLKLAFDRHDLGQEIEAKLNMACPIW